MKTGLYAGVSITGVTEHRPVLVFIRNANYISDRSEPFAQLLKKS